MFFPVFTRSITLHIYYATFWGACHCSRTTMKTLVGIGNPALWKCTQNEIRHPAQGTYIVQSLKCYFNLRSDVVAKFSSLDFSLWLSTPCERFFGLTGGCTQRTKMHPSKILTHYQSRHMGFVAISRNFSKPYFIFWGHNLKWGKNHLPSISHESWHRYEMNII